MSNPLHEEGGASARPSPADETKANQSEHEATEEEERELPFPLSHEALSAIHNLSKELLSFKRGDPITTSQLTMLVGELYANIGVINHDIEQLQDKQSKVHKMLQQTMPLGIKKQRSEQQRARICATGLELFNEAGDVAFMVQLGGEEEHFGLFVASCVFLALSLLVRVYVAARLGMKHGVKEGKWLAFLRGAAVHVIEPNSGHALMKKTLKDTEAGGQVFDTATNKSIQADKDPVAVMAHIDYSAGWAEIKSICTMVFGEDMPEFAIEAIYLARNGVTGKLGAVFWMSAVGTLLHMLFQLNELFITWSSLSNTAKVMEGRDKAFDKDRCDDKAVTEFAERFGGHVRKVNLGNCEDVTDESVLSLAQWCSGIHTIRLDGCTLLTDESVVSLAQHCTGIQLINLAGCPLLTDKSVVLLAQHCTSIHKIGIGGCPLLTDESVVSLSQHCTGIHTISLIGCALLTDKSVVSLAQHCTSIQWIGLGGCPLLTDKSVVSLAQHCTSIHTIWLYKCSLLTDKSVVSLAQHCTSIHAITLDHCALLTDESVVSLAQHCTSIHKICLSGCPLLTDESVVSLAQHCTSIHTIYLSGCALLTDESVVSLAQHCTSIQWIGLSGCALLTDESVVSLAQHCTSIHAIDLSGCKLLSERYQQQLGADFASVVLGDAAAGTTGDEGPGPAAAAAITI
eukprot:g1149.t1